MRALGGTQRRWQNFSLRKASLEEVITKLRAVEVELSPPIIPHLCTQ